MATDDAQLAKRISAITTKCLLTAVVLVAGLGFGRQVLKWWAAAPSESADVLRGAAIADGLGDPARLHVLQFGESPWSLRRWSVAGGKPAATAALRDVCREVLRQARTPVEEPKEAESDLLSRLAARAPVEEAPGKWRLFQMDDAFPMVVGTQPTPATADFPSGENLAATGHRVVVWGLALPAGPEAWTVFAFQPEIPSGLDCAVGPEFPIPPGCRRTLFVQASGGGAMLAFEGPPHPETWVRFYQGWFATHHWKVAGAWRQFGSRWHVRCTSTGQDPPSRWEVDVHFGSDGPGQASGLLVMSPSPSGEQEFSASSGQTPSGQTHRE